MRTYFIGTYTAWYLIVRRIVVCILWLQAVAVWVEAVIGPARRSLPLGIAT